MEIQMATEGDHGLLLTCSGNIDWEDRATLLSKVREGLAADIQPRIVMDFEAVGYVNSAGLGALFQLLEFVREREGKLVFASVPPALVRLFENIGLHQHVDLVDTCEEAWSRIDQPA